MYGGCPSALAEARRVDLDRQRHRDGARRGLRAVSLAWPRILEHVHGHVGWLAALALVHPAILLRRSTRRAMFAVVAATVLVTATAVMGAVMYPHYRVQIKPALF